MWVKLTMRKHRVVSTALGEGRASELLWGMGLVAKTELGGSWLFSFVGFKQMGFCRLFLNGNSTRRNFSHKSILALKRKKLKSLSAYLGITVS